MLWEIWFSKKCFSVRFFNWQYKYLHWQLTHSIRQNNLNQKKIARFMRKVYFFINLAIIKKDEIIAYKMIDLLKLSYGEAFVRPNEQMRLMHLCIAAIQEKQFVIAGYIIDAYTPMIRLSARENKKEILEQLVVISNIVKKINQQYLLDKLANCVFDGVKRFDMTQEGNAVAVLLILKNLGMVAIRNHDYALFREVKKNLLAVNFYMVKDIEEEFLMLLISWQHQILKRDYEEIFSAFQLMCIELRGKEILSETMLCQFIMKAIDFSSMIAANIKGKCGKKFLAMILKFAEGSELVMHPAINVVARTACKAIDLHGLQIGVSPLLILMEQGRKMLAEKLKFTTYCDVVKHRYLFLIIRELILVFDLMARQNHEKNNQFLMQVNAYWLASLNENVNKQLANQFCQLILSELVRNRKNKVHKLCENSKKLLSVSLFNTDEKKRLGLL